MREPRIDIAANTPLPGREAIGGALLADEDALVAALFEKARFSDDERQRIEAVATGLVEAARAASTSPVATASIRCRSSSLKRAFSNSAATSASSSASKAPPMASRPGNGV